MSQSFGRSSYLDIEVRTTSPHHAVVALRGRLDLWTAGQLDAALAGLIDDGYTQLALQLDDVGYVDSTGVTILLAAHKRLEPGGGELVVSSPCRRVRKVLAVTGAHKVLRIRHSKAAAA
jgi:anti-sigma B factor antagonist